MTSRDGLMLLVGIGGGIALTSLWIAATRQTPNPLRRRLAWLVAGAAAAGLIWLWVYTPRLYESASANTQASASATTRTGIFAALAGLVAIASTVVNARIVRISQQTLEETQTANQNAHTLEREGQVADRYTKAIGQLGSDSRAVRLGGLYALERIANDYEKDYHLTVVQVLSSFVREQSVRDVEAIREVFHQSRRPVSTEDLLVGVDVQAAVVVLTRLLPDGATERERRINLTGASLIGIRLRRRNLKGADLESVNLSQADLGRVDFTNAWLYKASLTDAWLNEAIFAEAYIGDADLTEARNLRQEQVESATGNERTRLPPDLQRPSHWLDEAKDTEVGQNVAQ